MKGGMEVELSMSNIGSPERVDQVKPLKHSAEKRMIPDLMYSGNRNIISVLCTIKAELSNSQNSLAQGQNDLLYWEHF